MNESKMIFRQTNAQRGREVPVTPSNSTNRHLSYGRIVLKEGDSAVRFENPEQETGLIVLSGAATVAVAGEAFELTQYDSIYIPRAVRNGDAVPDNRITLPWVMAAHREKEDRQFGVVNVRPDFASGGSGLEASRR